MILQANMTDIDKVTLIKLLFMEVNLVHHGLNLERRKMYPSNPRNNLISTIDLVWEKSLDNEEGGKSIKMRKKSELGEVNQNYTRAIEAKMQEQARFNKSSFRVMPQYNPQNKANYHTSNPMRDSLADQLTSFREKLKGQSSNSFHVESSNPRYNTQAIKNHILDKSQNKFKPIQNSNNISSSVFGYNVNYDTFKRESYLSQLLSDRLQPYLSKSTQKKSPKHSAFTINSPVPVYYQ